MIVTRWQLAERYTFTKGTRLFDDQTILNPVSRWNGGMIAEKLVKAGLATPSTVEKKTGIPMSIHLHEWPSQETVEALCLAGLDKMNPVQKFIRLFRGGE